MRRQILENRVNHQALLMGVGGPWTIKESPVPEPGPGQVLIKMRSSSICNLTDLHAIEGVHPPHDHQFQGMLPHDVREYLHRENDLLAAYYPAHRYIDDAEPFPTLMGHEGMGEIIKFGPVVDHLLRGENRNLQIGDRVGIFGLFGGLGEYVIAEADKCVKVPDNVSDDEAGLMEPISILLAATRKAVFLGENICILGGGALGLLAVQFCKLRGADKIIVSEPIAWKRDLALKFGATHIIDPNIQNVVKEVEHITDGSGCECVMECAGRPETIQMLPYIAKCWGVIIQIGAGSKPALVDWDYIHFKFLRVEGQHYPMVPGPLGPIQQMEATMKIISLGLLDIQSLITHRYQFSLNTVQEAFEEIRKGNVIKAVFHFDK
jgi:threonine dehydrogenase-like Zn-dependent dehydrogenase